MRLIQKPLNLILLIWAVFLADMFFHLQLARFGIYPRNVYGLIGIVTAPLLHGNLQHIISNTITLFVLLTVLWIFYRRIAVQIVVLSWLLGGLLIWIFARPVIHIGASALIYSIAAFLIAIGLFSGSFRSFIIALIIILLYGGLIYGVLPTDEPISWEGHLIGAIAGIILGYQYRFYKRK
ncbi:MAG: rhomboid family intramembrane serine protease [Bacteroidetes bacterium]|jgi:membrane associated rhomboid family serine protease|nr:rhomboid family intramembrane serine protease [Bacteroidota bacterium]